MTRSERQLRVFHLVVTLQFVISAAIIIGWTLYQANLHWWAIFSLSAQGIVIVFLGVLIYGFAVFRGAVGERIEAEHPFTGSMSYRLFYVLLPIIGGLAGGFDSLMGDGLVEAVRGWALGTVLAAYAVWLFIDPVAGVVESLAPQSRRLRAVRLAAERAERDRRRREKELLLQRYRAERRAVLDSLAPFIESRTGQLVAILNAGAGDPRYGADQAASIALAAWQAGGSDCMKRLYSSVLAACRAAKCERLASYLDFWWDGIGDWRTGAAAKLASAAV